MDLNYLLSRKGIDTKMSRVLVMRHVPTEPRLRKALPWLAAGEPDVFNAYQQSQGPKGEKQLTQAAYLASFIGHKAGEALFAGIYSVNGHRPISYDTPHGPILKDHSWHECCETIRAFLPEVRVDEAASGQKDSN
jgi:hypothetical protein